MISRKYETIVGIFVVASLVALLVMVMIIARQEGLFQEYVEYRAIFRNVSGLKVGSEVHLAGVTVGNVKEITINPRGSIVVTFKVIKKYSDRIRWDSQASIGFMGLLGEKSLDLTAGSLKTSRRFPPRGLWPPSEPSGHHPDSGQGRPQPGEPAKDPQQPGDPHLQDGGAGQRLQQDHGPGLPDRHQDQPGPRQPGNDDQQSGSLQRSYRKRWPEPINLSPTWTRASLGLPGKSGPVRIRPTSFHATVTDASQAASNLKEATTRLPNIVKKLDSFLTNLDKAGKGLPGLVTSGETLFSDADKAAKAAQQSWFLRQYVPKPEEHTIRMDGAPGKD